MALSRYFDLSIITRIRICSWGLLVASLLIIAFIVSFPLTMRLTINQNSQKCRPVYEYIKERTLGSSVKIFGKREVEKYEHKLPDHYCSEENIQSQAVEPWMSVEDKMMFNFYLKQQLEKNPDCMTYLEWGSGGSTFLALQYAHRVISIENYAEWCGIILQSPQVLCNILSGQLVFVCVDGGPVGQMGTPVDIKNYTSSHYIDVMKHFHDYQADFVLIDGRFRVATALASRRNSKPDSVMMFHDYKKWNDYRVVEKFFTSINPPNKLNNSVFGAFNQKEKIDVTEFERQQKIHQQKSH